MTTKLKRRVLRIKLQTLLLLLLVVCVTLGWKVQTAMKQRAAVAWVLQWGGTVAYDYELDDNGRPVPNPQPLVPQWLRERLFFDDVVEVTIRNEQVTDITPLAALQRLEYLGLKGTRVSDVRPLAGLTSLQWMRLNGTQVSDVTPLAGLTNLKRLYLHHTPVKDFTPLAELSSLERLYLDGTHVSDVMPLSGLTNLKRLGLHDTPVSKEDYEMLQKALPNCKIGWSPAVGSP